MISIGQPLNLLQHYYLQLRQSWADPEARLAWYVVPLLVLLALGATVAIGALVYCTARGMHLAATVDIGGGRYLIGCQ